MGTTLPLSEVVDVVVMISPQNPASPTFNQGLIVGTSATIPSVTGANPRIRLYTSLAGMTADGFSVESPEYVAAQIYFGQQQPALYLWVGRQDLTAIDTAIPHAANAGINYVVGDVVTVTQNGASLGQLQVSGIGAGGVVTALSTIVGSQGTGYSVAAALPTTGGSGTGLEVDITAIGESALNALQACRAASNAWYTACVLAATDADHIAIGEWAQAATPQLCYFFTTGTAAALNGAVGSVFAALKAGSYSRSFGIYSTTQGGLYPNNIYSQAAAMGVAMGRNTGLAGSYFTMKFKSLVGIAPETLNTQIAALEALNANIYLNYANSYSWLEQGTVSSGQFFDQILNIDMLASNVQYGLVNLLVDNSVIPQEDAGQTQQLNVANQACAASVGTGFIAPSSTWQGASISSIGLKTGQALPSGYFCGSPKYTFPKPANRASMPIYIAIAEAGGVHSILVGVYTQS